MDFMTQEVDVTLESFDTHDRSASQPSTPLPFLSARKVPSSRLLMSLNQLAVMSQNGIDISEAVDTAAKNARHPLLAEKLESIHDAISSGISLSAALEAYGSGLPETLPAMISAAESTGEVPGALTRVCELIRGELQLRSTVIGALIYPVILIIVCCAVMLAMLFGVLPQFAEVFRNMGRPMPSSTEILLGLGDWCRSNALLCAVVVGFGGVLAFLLRQHPKVKRCIDYCMIHGLVIRDAYRPLACGRMFRLLGAMLAGGIPLLQAVTLTRRAIRNSYLIELLDAVVEDVTAGEHASHSLTQTDILPVEAAQMVATAERTGRLAEVLSDCGEFYEEQGERVLKRIVHSLEPVIILAMGVLVAIVVLSIMLPLLDITSVT